MRRGVYPVVGVALVALGTIGGLGSLGASCDNKQDSEPASDVTGVAAGGESTPDGDRITEIATVDLSSLTRSEKRVWIELINDELSPCGEPVSVGRCAQERRSCRQCPVAARYLARLVTEGYGEEEIRELYQLRYGKDSEVKVALGSAPIRGAPMAPVTIAEFSDFECPYCGAAHPILEKVLREHRGKVRLAFFHYPLDGHAHALPAARAAVAAGNQGKFWEMHDLLFTHQNKLENEDLLAYATQLGLSIEKFQADLQSEATQQRVEQDREQGRRLGISGTPTLVINGRRFRESPESLEAYVREELDE